MCTGLSATFVLPKNLFGSHKKSLLVFTKSSGFEHDVVKPVDGHPSIVDNAVTALDKKYGFEAMPSKDGRIFDSKEFHDFGAVLFYTSGYLTNVGKDGNPAMTPQGKNTARCHSQRHRICRHPRLDRQLYTLPDPDDRSNRYIAHGEQSDPFIRMQVANHYSWKYAAVAGCEGDCE